MKYDWSKEHLESKVNESNCWFEWLRNLNIPDRGCNYRTLKNKASIYNIDTSHFNYHYAKTHNGRTLNKDKSNDEIFNDSIKRKTSTIKKEYINRFLDGIPRCENCNIKNWDNKPIVFQLHHKDGNHLNNNIENLVLLCPNCHSQTDNYANKK
jgi:hypothetical protein